jgi:dTDP-4-dehydrorhamnose 3,5-epimerase
MIHDVVLTPLKIIGDERGAVLHMLKHTDPMFKGFGEVYFSTIRFGQRKEWRRNQVATAQIAVPIGSVRLVLGDQRSESPTRDSVWEIDLGQHNYQLLTIPPMVWYALQNIGEVDALVANCSSTAHNPDAVERRDFTNPPLPYIWRN